MRLATWITPGQEFPVGHRGRSGPGLPRRGRGLRGLSQQLGGPSPLQREGELVHGHLGSGHHSDLRLAAHWQLVTSELDPCRQAGHP